ncbi:MAG: SulP family inorganic anion transporter [Clostridia bacterium]
MNLPVVKSLKEYDFNNIKFDIMSGISVAAIALPQNMAYAMILGINPVYGIYTMIVSMILSSIIGNSNYMIVGATEIIVVTMASNISAIETTNPLQVIFLLTFLVGIVQVILGLARLGYLVKFVAHPVVIGLASGVGFIILSGQMINILGLKKAQTHIPIMQLVHIFNNISSINVLTVIIGAVVVASIVVIQKVNKSLPSYLFGILVSMFVVYLFGWGTEVPLIESFSSAMPKFNMIQFEFDTILPLMSSAVSIALIGFVQTLSVIKLLEKNVDEAFPISREFISQGIVNIVCAFFNSFVIAGSFAKTFTNTEAGAKSRFSQFFAAIATIIIVFLMPPFAKYITKASLAALLILISTHVIDLQEIKKIFRSANSDTIIFLATFLVAVTAPRLDYAVYFGIVISIILVLVDSTRVNYSFIDHRNRAENLFFKESFESVKEDDVIVINLSGDIYFHTSEEFKKHLESSFVEGKEFVIRMRELGTIDMTSIKEIEKFIEKVQKSGKDVMLCGLNDEKVKTLERHGIIDKLGEDKIFRKNQCIFASTKDAIEKAEEYFKNGNSNTK